MKHQFLSYVSELSPDAQNSIKMKRKPEEEAEYLMSLYKEDALQIAKDCMTLFEEANETDCVGYWYQVMNCLKPNFIKH